MGLAFRFYAGFSTKLLSKLPDSKRLRHSDLQQPFSARPGKNVLKLHVRVHSVCVACERCNLNLGVPRFVVQQVGQTTLESAYDSTVTCNA